MAGKRKWIKSATENSHGQFKAKAKAAGENTKQFADEHAGDGGKTGKQARLAKALAGMQKIKTNSKKFREKLYGKE